MMSKTNFKAMFSGACLCLMLSACGGSSEKSGDQLLNSAGEISASEKASRESRVFAIISDDVISEPEKVVTLSGSQSYDELSTDTVSLQWSVKNVPNGADYTLELGENRTVTFVGDTVGNYIIELVATDGFNTDSTSANITLVEPIPVAVLPEPMSTYVENTATISGADSHDAIDTHLSYSWSVIAPNGDQAPIETNESNDAINVHLTQTGLYNVELTVTDSDGNVSPPAQTTITSINDAPVANAGEDIESPYKNIIEVNASASSDTNSEQLTYMWEMINQPDGSDATITTSITNPIASFFTSTPGEYTLQVTVSDGYESTQDEVVVTATNTLPTLSAGEDRTIQSGENLTLVAEAVDLETSQLIYKWRVVSSPTSEPVTIAGDTATLNVVLHTGGAYTFEVAVSDEFDTVTDSVEVYVNNSLPVSVINVAENDLIPIVGDVVRLSGSNSYDPDVGDSIEAYAWSVTAMPANSAYSLSKLDEADTEFTANTEGLYTISLNTSDGGDNSETTTVDIFVINTNSPPEAMASYSIENYTTVLLDASSSSDTDQHNISYLWSIAAKPDNAPVTIANVTAQQTTMFVQQNGAYVVRLIVSDGRDNSDPYDLVINIDKPNQPPIADAGKEQSVGIGKAVMLNGSGSFDNDEDPLSYSWFLTSPTGSISELDTDTDVTPSFTPDVFGTYTATLTVSDGALVSEADSVAINVSNQLKPVADAGNDMNVKTGTRVSLSGSNSVDADSVITQYEWAFTLIPEESNAVLTNYDDIDVNFTPDVPGTYILSLKVKDEETWSETSFVTVVASTGNAAPIADAGDDILITQGESTIVSLDAVLSSDADSDELSYSWSLISKPTLSNSEIDNANAQQAQLQLDRYGAYVAQLIVFDGTVSSLPTTKLIRYVRQTTAVNAGPDQEAYARERIILDGRNSGYIQGRDPESYLYDWKFVYAASETTPVIQEYVPDEDETEEETQGLYEFTPPVAGTYVVRLRFVNKQTNTVSDIDTLTVNILPYNSLPIANAGSDANSSIGEIVILDGSSSTDNEGDTLEYNWSFIARPDQSSAEINNPNSVNPFFEVDRNGEYIISLQVFDGSASSDPDIVKITSVEPSVAFDVRTNDGYRRLSLPFEKNETRDVVDPENGNELTLNTFRLTSIERQVTIIDVSAYDANGLVTPYIDITNDTVIRKNESIEINFLSDYPNKGRQANLVFSFKIKETGDTVSGTYLISVN